MRSDGYCHPGHARVNYIAAPSASVQGRSVTTDWRRLARGAARRVGVWGRRVGVLRYQPERWTTEQWNEAYTARALDYYAELNELARYSVIGGYVRWFTGVAAPNRPGILDVGCGTGLLREHLEGVEFSQYVGVDLSDAAIRAATARAHPRSRFLVGDVSNVDLGRFDIAVLNEVLYYAPKPLQFLARMRSILHPRGALIVSMWRHPGDRSLWRRVDESFTLLDRVEVRNRSNPVNRRGWLVACYAASGTLPSPGPDQAR